jgi:hypothetical protein
MGIGNGDTAHFRILQRTGVSYQLYAKLGGEAGPEAEMGTLLISESYKERVSHINSTPNWLVRLVRKSRP